MGGRVGMILALTQPELVDKLVVVDSTPVNTPLSLERSVKIIFCYDFIQCTCVSVKFLCFLEHFIKCCDFRWETLGKACKVLQGMEGELREQTGVSRSILAEKVRVYYFF